MIKVYLDGAKHISGQVNRIGEGLVELGCELTDFVCDSDLIYSNNSSPTRTQIVRDKVDGKLKPGAKLIFTVLDYPEHIAHTESFQKEIPQIKADLGAADAICSISEYTQRMVKEKYGFESTVIYNPQKPTENLNIDRNYFACIVGRKFDKNKNVISAIRSLQALEVPEEKVLMVGSESIGWGNYQGVLTDENLNKVYNSCLFSFSLGVVEGINLPAVEAASVGCIPVIHSRLTTRQELFPEKYFSEYSSITDSASISSFIRSTCNVAKLNEFQKRLISHHNINLRRKFNRYTVAERILEIYNNL